MGAERSRRFCRDAQGWAQAPADGGDREGIRRGRMTCAAGAIMKSVAPACGRSRGECRLLACAVKRRRFPVGARPTRQPLQPEATGAVMEVTKWLKPSDSVSRYTVTARVCRP